jgi:hypothetical protein
VAAALDPVGVLLAPPVWLTIALLYDAAGDTLSFFGEPGDPTAARRAVLAGAVPGPLILAFPDTGYGLFAIWTLGPFALGAALVGVLRSPGARLACDRGRLR